MSQQIEIPNHEYRPLQFGIRDMLALMLIVAVLASTSRFPPSMFHCLLMLIALYLIKIRIVYLRTFPIVATGLYFITVIALLPYLYFCTTFVWWDNEGSSPLANWIGGPIAAFTIPTIFSIHELCTQEHPRLWIWILRSVIEIVVFIPIWIVLWFCFKLSVLGWEWIPL